MTSQFVPYVEPNLNGTLAQASSSWAVLMLHGFTAGPESVRPWAQALADAGATVHVPLLTGHGTSVSDLARTTAGQWRRDVQQSLDTLLAADYDHIAVCGHSMGGTLALDAAAHRPVTATFLVNPALSFRFLDGIGAALSPVLQYIVPTVGPLAGDINKPHVSEEAYPRTPVAAVQQLAKLFWITRRNLANIQSPVTLYQSFHDHVVPASSANILQRRLKNAALDTVMLQNSYHVATLDYDAEAIHRHTISRLLAFSARSK
ncbi:MAG TPA: alpha/beta fold hydrolase [Candidatus Yaniella excrementigallinarum]|nr:alpha/beta fold hydrolase [Candidatus Yaniella excrementigallinarum]